ncbi:hypothetical protein L596_000089 [Steinernema carpocapsae]|uniref:Uncharacterized protein n=1 Tax=Steinernema carpocapsae TaxID=34508 RepID=A0A4U8UJI8_STECR|nr:hypothetical protein L596_000089 [Steinernema carpocapsae]
MKTTANYDKKHDSVDDKATNLPQIHIMSGNLYNSRTPIFGPMLTLARPKTTINEASEPKSLASLAHNRLIAKPR